MSHLHRPDPVIDALLDDFLPVRVVRPHNGLLLAVAAVGLSVLAVTASFAVRPDILALDPAMIVLQRSGALLLLGLGALWAALVSARPGVGGRSNAWLYATPVAAMLPAAAMLGVISGDAEWGHVLSSSVYRCFGISSASAVLIAGVVTWWLQRGAVTEPARAAWLTGIAAGALGTFVYNLICPSSTLYYAALWYSLTVLACAGAARLIIPGFLRW